LNIDYTTLRNDNITILLAWTSYRFSDRFELFFGKGKVPGGREWLITSMNTLGPERSLATTFFRPSITTGVWAKGEPIEDVFYQGFIGNGFNTASGGFRELDTNFVYAVNGWWEPLGEFGGLYSDFEYQETLRTRLGSSITASKQSGQQFDNSQPEDSFIRLSDGTDLTLPGALGAGFTVTEYSVLLATFDLSAKYHGVSLHGEYFLRWLSDIGGTGAFTIFSDTLFDHGFHVQSGLFFVPKVFEVYGRGAVISGTFGSGYECASGFNYFVRRTSHWRISSELAYIEDSPTEQIRTGYEVGASGLLARMQLQTVF
jgi:hypothetical protein